MLKLCRKDLYVFAVNFAQYAIHWSIDLGKLVVQVPYIYFWLTLTYRKSLVANVLPLFCKNITRP